MPLPASARDLTDDDESELVDLARSTINANTDAGPDEDGVHTMGAVHSNKPGETHFLPHPNARFCCKASDGDRSMHAQRSRQWRGFRSLAA